MPEGISRFVKPRPGHPPSDAYNVAFAAKNGAEVVQGGEREEGENTNEEGDIYFARTGEREGEEDLLGGQISRRRRGRRGCGREMGTIRSYTPEGTEGGKFMELLSSLLAGFTRLSCHRGKRR